MTEEINKLREELEKLSSQLTDLSRKREEAYSKYNEAIKQEALEIRYKDAFEYCRQNGVEFIRHGW